MRKPPENHYLSLPDDPGFYVSLSVNGATVPLYNIQSTSDKTTCYVESREGAHFAVNFGDERSKRKKGFQATILIDGQWQRGKNILKEAPPTHWSLGARRDSESTERPFVFDELSKTSEESVASTSETLHKSLASIELRYRRMKKVKSRNSEVKGEFETPEPTTVHEDSKLACLSHQGRLGPSQIAQFKEERQKKFKFYESKEEPYHSFVFLYRSREFLESLNIPLELVPDTPVASSSPSASPRPQPPTFLRSWLVNPRASTSSSSSSSSINSIRTQRRLSGTAETDLSFLPRAPDLDQALNFQETETELEKLRELERELEGLKRIERIARKRSSGEAFGEMEEEGGGGRWTLEEDGIEIQDEGGTGERGRKSSRRSTNGNGRVEEQEEEEVIVLSD